MKTQLIIVLMSIFNFFNCDTKKLKRSDNILDLISGAGYIGEAHRVVTEDGYLLKVHRVLANPVETRTLRKPAFLMHGILATAADFLVTGPDIALAYMLADNGYDVCFVHRIRCFHLIMHLNLTSSLFRCGWEMQEGVSTRRDTKIIQPNQESFGRSVGTRSGIMIYRR